MTGPSVLTVNNNEKMKKRIIVIFAALFVAQMTWGQIARMVCNETCRDEYQKTEAQAPKKKEVTKKEKAKPAQDKPVEQTYAVVSPVGGGTVEAIKQAPRLSTLEGKTIAVVGVSFMTNVTHPEIKRLILENYPGAKVLLLDEIGFAGPYPAPGIERKQKIASYEVLFRIARYFDKPVEDVFWYE